MDEAKPEFASTPLQQPKPPNQLNPEHKWTFERFVVPRKNYDDFLEALGIPVEPPSPEEWTHKQIELGEEAKKNLNDTRAKLAAELANKAAKPQEFFASLMDNLGDILTRAGWRMPNPPGSSISPTVNPVSEPPVK
ncbi:hypothetical protein HY357_00715 [Candidatus Roizmanbacteria bacterium]|nr:hypothetical protein [Candidatus Roizmanbacteria bacterium]